MRASFVPLSDNLVEFIVGAAIDSGPLPSSVLSDLISDLIVIAPTSRLCRDISSCFFTKRQLLITPRIITYSSIADSLEYFSPEIHSSLPEVTPKLDALLMLRELDYDPQSLYDLLVELDTFAGDIIGDIAGDAHGTSFLPTAILELLDFRKRHNIVTKASRLNMAADSLYNFVQVGGNLGKSFICILPYNNIPYIKKIISALTLLDATHIVIHACEGDITLASSEHDYGFIMKQYLNEFNYKLEGAHDVKQKWELKNAPNAPKVIQAKNTSEEARIVWMIVKDIICNKADESIAVVSKDAELKAMIKHYLHSDNITYDDTDADTLSMTDAFRVFLSIYKLINIEFDRDLLLLVFPRGVSTYSLEQYLRRNKKVDEIDSIIKCKSISSEIKGILAEYTKLRITQLDTLDGFIKRHLDVYTSVFGECEKMNMLRHIACSIEICMSECRYSYTKLLSATVGEERLREEVRYNQDVTFITPMEFRGRRADNIIMCGLEDSVFPGYSSYSFAMDKETQQSLNFPPKEEEYGYAEYDFLSICNNRSVYLITREKTLCRYVEKLGLYNSLNIDLYYNQMLYKLARRHEYKPMERPAPVCGTFIEKISATALERLLKNPYAYYVHNILKLRAMDDISYEVLPKDIGIIIHGVLSQLSSSRIDCFDTFKETIWNAMGEYFSDISPSLQYNLKEKLFNIAKGLLEYEAGIYKRHTELVIESSSYGITVIAIVDRVDEMNDGVLRVIDYKTGTLPSKKSIIEGPNIQILLEAVLAMREFPEYKKVEAMLLRVSGNALEKIKKLKVDVDKTVIGEKLSEVIDAFLLSSSPKYFIEIGGLDEQDKIFARLEEWWSK